jgi:hypothetical protein
MLTQFFVAVKRKPPSTAKPKPKNISWACHCIGVIEWLLTPNPPVYISAQVIGSKIPDKVAKIKKGRNPTDQIG